MARAADKAGDRTIGVLTKADMIEPGTHDTWLQVLNNNSDFRLRLWYFCIVNPSQVKLVVTELPIRDVAVESQA